MKRLKSLLIGFSVLLLLIQTIPIQAMPQIDKNKKASLELNYQYDEQALGNINGKIYKVGDISPEGSYALIGEFKQIVDGEEVTLEYASDWYNMGKALSKHIRANLSKSITKIKSNGRGEIFIDNLKPGLYLILTEKRMTDDLEIRVAPTLIALPYFDEERQVWVYDREAYPKSEGRAPGDPEFEIDDEELPGGPSEFEADDDGIPGGPSEFEADDEGIPAGGTDFEADDDGIPGGPSELPQTGMPMKPIMYMALIGVILFTVGWIDYQRK